MTISWSLHCYVAERVIPLLNATSEEGHIRYNFIAAAAISTTGYYLSNCLIDMFLRYVYGILFWKLKVLEVTNDQIVFKFILKFKTGGSMLKSCLCEQYLPVEFSSLY